MKSFLTSLFFCFCCSGISLAVTMPDLPDWKKGLKDDHILMDDEGKMRKHTRNLTVATDLSLDEFKKKIAGILGANWLEIPAPEPEETLAPNVKDPFGNTPDGRKPPRILGIAVFATAVKENGKKTQWQVQLFMTELSTAGKKHNVAISVFRP